MIDAVKWGRPARRMIGKSGDIDSGDRIYTSKCRRYTITKTRTLYRLRVHSGASYEYTKDTIRCESLRDAKDQAELQNNPEWDCD